MSDYRVKFRRGDTGAVVDRRVQAGSSNAAKAAVESRGHTVLEINDGGGVALADESDHAPAYPPPAPLGGGEVVALLRSIDKRLSQVERSGMVTQPCSTVAWGIIGGWVLAALLTVGIFLLLVVFNLVSFWSTVPTR